jgi:hypothetical protein
MLPGYRLQSNIRRTYFWAFVYKIIVVKPKEVKTGWSDTRQIWQNILRKDMAQTEGVPNSQINNFTVKFDFLNSVNRIISLSEHTSSLISSVYDVALYFECVQIRVSRSRYI